MPPLNHAIIGIGSNIEPGANIPRAIAAVGGRCRIVGRTSPETTRPIGLANQPDFVNLAVRVETDLGLDELRAFLKQVEDDLGRVRTADKFGPRTIDLDILVWNGRIVDQDVHDRDFLQREIADLWPEVLGPGGDSGRR